MQFYIWILIAIFCRGGHVWGSDNKLRTEIIDTQELVTTFKTGSVKEIQEYLKENNLSVNAQWWNRTSLLHFAITCNKFELVNYFLDQEDIEVNTRNIDGETALHRLTTACACAGVSLESHEALIKKLVKKGCPINALDMNKRTALGGYHACRSSWRGSSSLIENGALLMCKEGEKSWNVLDAHLRCLREKYPTISKLNNPFTGSQRIIKDILFTKFGYDYKNYGKDFLKTALVCNYFKSVKKCIIPKVLVQYITSFMSPSPIEHIEETLEDAWSRHLLNKPILFEDHPDKEVLDAYYNYKEILNTYYNNIIKHITPGTWKDAWNDYKRGDRAETNLVVTALNYMETEVEN